MIASHITVHMDVMKHLLLVFDRALPIIETKEFEMNSSVEGRTTSRKTLRYLELEKS